jgi:hypothetical protein
VSAAHDTNAGPSVLESSGQAGLKTLFGWVGLSLLGFPLGGYVGYLVAGPVDGVAPAFIGGALTGAGIGLAQWVMLRRNLHIGPVWIAATSVALAVGLPVGAKMVNYETTISQLALMGAISGVSVGIAQGLLMRDKFPLWQTWIVAMPALWALGWVVTTAIGIGVENQFTVFGAAGATVFGILSGLLLLAGLRRERTASQ